MEKTRHLAMKKWSGTSRLISECHFSITNAQLRATDTGDLSQKRQDSNLPTFVIREGLCYLLNKKPMDKGNTGLL